MWSFIGHLVWLVPIAISVAFVAIAYKVECKQKKEKGEPKSVKSSLASLTLKEALTVIIFLVLLLIPIVNILVTWGVVGCTNEQYDIMDLTADELKDLFTEDVTEEPEDEDET
jgi:nitrogen fixation-related uncharacterized protein